MQNHRSLFIVVISIAALLSHEVPSGMLSVLAEKGGGRKQGKGNKGKGISKNNGIQGHCYQEDISNHCGNQKYQDDDCQKDNDKGDHVTAAKTRISENH